MKPLRRLTSLFLFILIISGGSFYWLSQTYVVPVMMFHRVSHSDTIRTDTVSPERFRTHLQYIKDHGYQVITLKELMEGVQQGVSFPRNTIVLTFDDGYSDNYKNALPILREFQYPATIFIVPGNVGRDGFLNWEQMKEMHAYGIDFGSHGMTEAYLPDQTEARRKHEIFESKRLLEKNLGIPIEYFSYPVGGFSNEIKSLVQNSGYKGAIATNRGHDRYNRDIFEINRIRLSDKDNREIYLWAKFTGYYNHFRKMKNPY